MSTKTNSNSQIIVLQNPTVDQVKSAIEEAGNTIGSVHFMKRSDGQLRKMCYRLHVKKPSVAKPPKGVTTKADTQSVVSTMFNAATTTVEVCSVCGRDKGIGNGKCGIGPFKQVPFVQATSTPTPVPSPVIPTPSKKDVDNANDQITVLDCNGVSRDQNGNILGRGQWRTIPLENVVRISVKGKIFQIIK